MSAKVFSGLAATIFLLVGVAQGVRGLKAIDVSIGAVDVPVLASWIACGVLLFLALIGFRAATR